MCPDAIAIELARTAFPGEVVRLELEYANYLTSLRQHDAAILHFIEAGCGSSLMPLYCTVSYHCERSV